MIPKIFFWLDAFSLPIFNHAAPGLLLDDPLDLLKLIAKFKWIRRGGKKKAGVVGDLKLVNPRSLLK